MNRFFRSLSVLVVMLAAAPGITQAQNCQSAAKVASDIFEKVGTEAVALGCSAVKIALGKDDTFDQQDLLACYKDASFYTNLTSSLTGWWNNQIANNGWATVGPRRLSMNQDSDGTLIGTSGRMFMLFPMEKDNATITITERDGKAKTSVIVCKHSPPDEKGHTGKYIELETRWFNDTNDRQREEHEERKIELTGVKGYEISVHLDAKSVTNTFAYTRVSKNAPSRAFLVLVIWAS